MAGRGVYQTSICIPTEAIQALLASGSSPGGFHDSRPLVNFEEVCQRSLYQPLELEETGDEVLDECLHQPEKKRRLAADQVQFLERSFELENKLEPDRKIQLARDLGLQPRQVAIWFQNRRARWKTKQLEKDYEALKSSYNVVKADYENLLTENEKLKAEVLFLTDKLLRKEKGNPEECELNKSRHQLLKPDFEPVSEAKRFDTLAVVCKQEDLSSANSAVFDSDSPHYTNGRPSPLLDPAESPNAFEPDHSDLSHAGEDEESKGYCFPKLEDNSRTYGFPMEDQAFWFWPY